MAKVARKTAITILFTEDEYQEITDRANEQQISRNEWVRRQLWSDKDALIRGIGKLERAISGLRQDFRAVYFPNHDL